MKIGIRKIESKKIVTKTFRLIFVSFGLAVWLTLSLFNGVFFWQIPLAVGVLWVIYKLLRILLRMLVKFKQKGGGNDDTK